MTKPLFQFPHKPIDHGFVLVTPNMAGRLAKPFNGLPRLGYERAIKIDGKGYWLTRIHYNGNMHWAFYPDSIIN